MKKKPLTNYPSIPAPKIDQFTLPELAVQLLRNKQFTKGLKELFSNCIISKNHLQPISLGSKNINNRTQNNNLTSPTSTVSSKKANQKLSSSSKNISQQITLSQEDLEQECEFIFENSVKNTINYPWMIGENGDGQVVECNLITDEITEAIEETIQNSLHKILNKEFINVTNQILAMREQINVFTRQELDRSDSLRSQIQRQMEKMQKKVQQQQHISTSILNQPLQKFSRSKAMLLNSSISNNSTKQSNMEAIEDFKGLPSVQHQIYSLKKQVQMLKKSFSSGSNKSSNHQYSKHLQQKLAMLQDKVTDLTLSQKLQMEEQKQKCKKNYEQLYSQLSISNSKQFMSQEVKKSVKSNLKIYLDEIMKCKKDIEQLYERIDRNDKGMQDYMGNQLKNVWTLVSGIKTRIENVEEQFGVGMDQSFVF